MRKSLSPRRQEHSFSVAALAETLCLRYGASPQKGFLAGLAHDIAREKTEEQLLILAAADGRTLAEYERQNPVLLHGRAAAAILCGELGVEDEEVLQAVRDHVAGRPAMGLLAKILFAADFLEPGRPFLNAEFRRKTLGLELDAMLLMVMERLFDYFRQEGIPMAEPACRMYEELRAHVQRH